MFILFFLPRGISLRTARLIFKQYYTNIFINTHLREDSAMIAFFVFSRLFAVVGLSVILVADVLQLPDGGHFGAIHFQYSTNFDTFPTVSFRQGRTKLDLTTEPPLMG